MNHDTFSLVLSLPSSRISLLQVENFLFDEARDHKRGTVNDASWKVFSGYTTEPPAEASTYYPGEGVAWRPE